MKSEYQFGSILVLGQTLYDFMKFNMFKINFLISMFGEQYKHLRASKMANAIRTNLTNSKILETYIQCSKFEVWTFLDEFRVWFKDK